MAMIKHITHEEDIFEVYGTRRNDVNQEEFLIYKKHYGGWKWVPVSDFEPFE
ncbi:hypothetical protein NSQ37_15375 [Bacillus sp. FSL P4-0334]|uniref:hypothetical protein n=1 Tax=Bacillus sp. FSL P4-0334 TaxID=2954520 RepID=UPI0030F8FCA9